jgi:N-sulfoglucosamine sulfohydrolase
MLFRILALLLLLAAPAGAGPRNVLLIIADDQGRDLGAYGNAVVRTPHLDTLAARGTLFTHAFATVSSCSPSRSVILTGRYSHSNGMYGLAHDVHNQHLLPRVQTLPQLLKAAGYRTGLVGKKHVLPEAQFPFDAELAPERSGVRDVAFMADEAKRFLSTKSSQPFFLLVGYSDPHRAPENFGNTREWPEVPRQTYAPKDVLVPGHLPDVAEVRQDLAEYYESLSRLDSGVGLLLEAVRQAGHERDTLVIYLSDNGSAFPGAKTTLYDTGIHLPLIVAAPDAARRGVRNEAMVSWIDVMPTILDWAGAPRSADPLPGRSILPILAAEKPAGWDRIFASHNFHEIQQYYPMRALRTRRYKYIVNLANVLSYPIAGDIAASPSWQVIERAYALGLGVRSFSSFLHRPREELYDLSKDPDEVDNLAVAAKHRPLLEQMRSEMEAFRRATRDPWLAGQAAVHGHDAH